MIFLIVTAGFCALFYVYMTWTFTYWKKKGVPCKPPVIFFGNFSSLLLLKKSLPEVVLDYYNWFECSYFGAYRVRTPMLIVKDPAIIKSICIKDFSNFCNRGIPVNSSEDPLSRHLFNLEGNEWRWLRAKLTPVFTSGKIKKMFPLLSECNSELSKSIESEIVKSNLIGVSHLATNFVMDVIGSCAFGIQVNSLKNKDSEFRKIVELFGKPSYKVILWRMLRTAIPGVFKFFGVRMNDTRISDSFIGIVKAIVNERKTSGVRRNDFIDLLIQIKENGSLTDGSELCQDELNSEDVKMAMDEKLMAAQAFGFFIAGYETSANTIAFCMHELAMNPQIQETVREDINRELLGDDELTYEAVDRMKYLHMVALETLRKYPEASILSRKCETSYRLPDNVVLPAKMRVVIPIYGIHHDEKYYPEPSKFIPERFTKEEIEKRPMCTFLPFGDGPRSCIGVRFALLQVKMGLIAFLRQHRFEICDKSAIPMIFSKRSLVTKSENGIWLRALPI